MTPRLDRTTLDRLCGAAPEPPAPATAARAVQALGWLAPWWLPPEVLCLAARHQPAYRRYANRPSLPFDPGGCWVLFVRPHTLPLLRPAFVLPLRWRRGAGDDPHLPGPLGTLARLVHGQAIGAEGERWGLRLAVPQGEEPRDLSGLGDGAVGAGSGWAALVGGLLLARDGTVPDWRVWASAAWDEQFGIGRVEGVPAKLALAQEWGATQIFVPAQNQPEVADRRGPQGGLTVELLAPVSRDPKLARLLAPYLDLLGTVPDLNAPIETRRAFYGRVGRRRANEFYRTHLLADAIVRCRERLRQDHPSCRPTHLVTVVGNQAPVVALAPAALEVKHCLLLHEDPPDKLITQNRDQVSAFLAGRGIDGEPVGVRLGSRGEELGRIRALVRDFAAGVPPADLAFDLTPGYKSLSLELEESAPPGGWLLYCRHLQMPPDNRVDPTTERYDCWTR